MPQAFLRILFEIIEKMQRSKHVTSCVDVKVGGLIGNVPCSFQPWAFCNDFAGVSLGFVNVDFKWALRDVLSCKEDCDLQVTRETDVTAAPWPSRAPPNLVFPSNLLSAFSGMDTQRWLEAGVLKSGIFTSWTYQAYGYAHAIRYTWSFILFFSDCVW